MPTTHRTPARILAFLGFVLFIGSFLVSAGPLRATPIIKCVTGAVPQVDIATVSNSDRVAPGASTPSQFVIAAGSPTVLSLATYHYLPPGGLQSPGQIGLRSSDGKVYGPWQTTGSSGSGGVANALWTATINIVLPPGTYTVTDTDPATWSANAGTGGAGMFWATGYLDGAKVLPVPVQLYSNSNGDSVAPGATALSQFQFKFVSVHLASLTTYHYVVPKGLPSTGQIGLRGSDGKIYGPWQTTGKPGPGGIANAFWTATINVDLPPGTYTVTDSDPTTWSANAGTGGAGMFWVTGYQK